jgi:hypothetical protein
VVTGTRFVKTIGVYEQSPGGLDGRISGTLTGELSGSTITFSGSDTIDVLPHPDAPFLPDVPDSPGQEYNYGAYTRTKFLAPNGEAAILDAQVQLTGGSATLGQPATMDFLLTSGILDVRIDEYVPATYVDLGPLSGTSPNISLSPVTGDLSATIQIPIDVTFRYTFFEEDDSWIVLEGLIVANRVVEGDGDYNNNGFVETADYVVWRKFLDTNGPHGDGDNNGTVNDVDYQTWYRQYGQSGMGGGADVVPEPGTLLMLLTLLLSGTLNRSR